MAVAPYDPLAQVHQRNLRLYAPDVQNSINPTTPGQIPGSPVGGSGTKSGSGDGLGSKESGWERSERFQNAAGNAFTRSSSWQDFAKGTSNNTQNKGAGSAEIDGNKPAKPIEKPKLEFPTAANMEQRQGLAYDFAAAFQEHARDALRTLGIGKRA